MKKIGLLVMPLMTISLLTSCGSNNGKDYIVYFDTNGGLPEVERQIVIEGDYAKDPQIDVKRDGISLSYWSLQDEEEDSPTEFIFEDNKITSDITLHAIYPIDLSNHLAITCTKESMTLCLYWSGKLTSPSELDIKWSKDKKEWTDVKVTLEGTSMGESKIEGFEVNLNKNETVYLAGDNPNGFSFANNNDDFRIVIISNDRYDEESEFEVSGNALSLIDSVDYESVVEIPPACFSFLFSSSNIKSAKNLKLPCNQLSVACYKGMFKSCKKLTAAPSLPAMNLASECYRQMFSSCAMLEEAPSLPVSSFDENCIDCYSNMFSSCATMNHIKVGFGEGDVWPKVSSEDAFTRSWLFDTIGGVFEWKGSTDPTDFFYSADTVPKGWTIKHY